MGIHQYLIFEKMRHNASMLCCVSIDYLFSIFAAAAAVFCNRFAPYEKLERTTSIEL